VQEQVSPKGTYRREQLAYNMKPVQYTTNMSLISGGCGGIILAVNHDTTVGASQRRNNFPADELIIVHYSGLAS